MITKHGGPDSLEVQERPSPELVPGSVLIDVRAAGVNFSDVMATLGLYADAPPLPSVVGYEVSGVIAEIAPDVVDFSVGDRVIAGTRFGGYAERVCVQAQDVLPLPDSWCFEQGAAFPVNYTTAWVGLVDQGGLRFGEKVLIHAAAGGVGIAAVQIAKSRGAVVYGTASPGKLGLIRDFGVDVALNSRTRSWSRDLPPMDVVMDALGGKSVRRSYRQLRPGGRLVAYGATSVVAGSKVGMLRSIPDAVRMIRGFNLIGQMTESKTVIGLNMLRLWDDRGTLQPWISPLGPLITTSVITPVVSEAVPFSNASAAHRMLLERRNVGKVVLVP